MALQNPKLFGYEIAAALTDVSDKSLALRRLNLPPFDLEVIRGSANAGMIPNDWRSFSRLSVPIVKTVDRFSSESGQYTGLVNNRAGTNTALFGNLNVNGSISGKAIRYNYVDFDDNNKVKIADISTSRVSAWSSSDPRATNTNLSIQANASISYGAQVGISTAAGELVFGTQGGTKTVSGVTYSDSLGPRIQTSITPEKKEFDSETPTHKIKVKLGGTDVWLYAMKGIPYSLKGLFNNIDAEVKLTARKPDGNGNPISASWKVVETGNSNKYVNFVNKGDTTTKISFRSPVIRERFVQFYYDPDYIKEVIIPNGFIDEIPEIKLANATNFNLSNNALINLPDFNFLTPQLNSINLSGNELHKSDTESERFLNPITIAKFPSTIVSFSIGNAFFGSIRGQTTGTGDGNASGDGTYTAKDLIARRFPNLTTLNLNSGGRYFHNDDVDTAYLPNIPSTCTSYSVQSNKFTTIAPSRSDNGSNAHFPNGSFSIEEAENLTSLNIRDNHTLSENPFSIASDVISTIDMHHTALPFPNLAGKTSLTKFTGTHCGNAYSLFTNAGTDANAKDVMSGFKFDACDSLTELQCSHANLKNDRFPKFTNAALETLNLYETGIKGGTPAGGEANVIAEDTFENCVNIKSINIQSSNLLTTAIHPYAFVKCAQLSSFSYNSSNRTGGNLPDFSANGNLSSIALANNAFTGGMPSFVGSPLINYINLSNNNLSGLIPNLLNLTKLTNLYLFGNDFSSIGTFTNLSSLTRFEAHNNNLGGAIPSFVGTANLQYLILFNNNFNAYTSGSFAELRRVKYIDVANNDLGQQAVNEIIDDMYTNYQTYGSGRRIIVNLRGNATPSEESLDIIAILRTNRITITYS